MIFETLLFLAQTPTAPPRQDSMLGMMVPMMFVFLIFYFLTIRPQRLKQKKLVAQIAATKTGDKVITSSGIHGMIANVKDATFILKIADNVKIEIDKASIATVLKSGTEITDAKA